jgi:hypothetical protein
MSERLPPEEIALAMTGTGLMHNAQGAATGRSYAVAYAMAQETTTPL